VNELGFRLATEGYQLHEFEKNPIGFAQHDRNAGVIVKWEDLKVEGDKITGVPVINLSHPMGQQILDEVENGFRNAASMGYFVFEEWSDAPELKLAGQTGPTITKWWNKECSLVDIPANANALKLFSATGQELALDAIFKNADQKSNIGMEQPIVLTPDAARELKLAGGAHDSAIVNAAIITLAGRANKAEADLKEYQETAKKAEVKALLDVALEGKKVTVELSAQLEKDYANNPAGLKALLQGMGAYVPVTQRIDEAAKKIALKYEGLTWDDMMEKGLAKDCKLEAPEVYASIYKKAFKKDLPQE
jgi:hypothetical protein